MFELHECNGNRIEYTDDEGRPHILNRIRDDLLNPQGWSICRITKADIASAAITTAAPFPREPRRLICRYCDCISTKESGTCEHCGAPLVFMD